MRKKRQGERGQPPFRSERFFIAGGMWYFATREQPLNGPFVSQSAAEAALERQLDARSEPEAQP